MRVFLTGATGFIGQPLTRCLIARGWNVVALVRTPNSPHALGLTKMGAQCVPGDVTDRESMRAGMTGADLVVHAAGMLEYGVTEQGRRQMHAVNVDGTDNLLSLAEELGIPRIVHVSASLYYGETGSETRDESYHRQKPFHSYYEQTKTEAHEIGIKYIQRGLPLIIVCPGGVVGPNSNAPAGYFLRAYLNHMMTPYAWAPDSIQSLVHVQDAAEGIALAAEKGRIGETYLLAGEPTSQREVLRIWMTRPGGLKVRFYIPTWLAKMLVAPMEPFEKRLGMPTPISRETVSSTSVSNASSSAKAVRELGWTYRTAEKMWADTIDDEVELLANRKQRDLVSRLKPTETDA